jgi:hypothetical protein
MGYFVLLQLRLLQDQQHGLVEVCLVSVHREEIATRVAFLI